MAKKKFESGLGRGLNALLGDPEIQTSGEGSVSLPISQVERVCQFDTPAIYRISYRANTLLFQ